jgi:predicted acyltransferase
MASTGVVGAATQKAAQEIRQAAAPRLHSLDAFRGLTIAGMILVNNPGTWTAVYAPLRHAAWHGWTPTDLIFPFFLFIVGVSMMFSLTRRREQSGSRTVLLHVLYRSLVIFAIGFFLTAFPYFRLSVVRIPGVLPRIAVCYLVASLIVLATGRRGRLAVLVALLVGYWLLMRYVPVPGFGAGRFDVDGNLAGYIDRAVLGRHIYTPTGDPEGLLSTLPAIATVLFGTFAGEFLRSGATARRKIVGLLVAGAIGLAIGRVLHPFFPINKNLWTSTFSIFTAGFACVLLGTCYWLIDVRGWRAWAKPFVVFGVNPILAYAVSSFVTKNLMIYRLTLNGSITTAWGCIFQKVFAPLASPVDASLLFAVTYVGIWLAVMWWFYRKKIFVKI